MLIQNRYIIDHFIKEHPISRKPLNSWETTVRQVIWTKPAEVKQTFGSVSFVGKTTIFNVGGNKWRLLSHIEYQEEMVIVTGVFTHKQYDKLKIT
jgi:mRNA interferase HigB